MSFSLSPMDTQALNIEYILHRMKTIRENDLGQSIHDFDIKALVAGKL